MHCDQYQAYKQLPYVTLVGCWAHARRKFSDAAPTRASEVSLAQTGIVYCNQMFKLEHSWKDLSSTERKVKRKAELKPLMDEFFTWCKGNQAKTLPNSKLGMAFAYCLNHEEAFKNVLLNGDLALSNNLAERSIKSVVMGRKNWLFSQSYEGAKASAIIMSITETAKRHKLNTEKYLKYLLEKLPNEANLTENVLEAYLPWAKEIQENCK